MKSCLNHSYRTSVLMAIGLTFYGPPLAQGLSRDDEPEGEERIAVLLDGPSKRADALLEKARVELENFGHTGPNLFPKNKARTGDFTLGTVTRHLDDALADPDVDIIWAFGPIGSAAAVERAMAGRLDKPVVAPFVPEPMSRLLRSVDRDTSYLSYVVFTPALSRDLKALLSVRPVRHLAYVMARPLLEAIPATERALKADAEKVGVRLHVVSGRDPQALIQGLPSDIDAVYVGFDPQQRARDTEALAEALIARQLPSFSQIGRLEVERGLFMGLGGPENGERLARAVAVNTDAILAGESPGTLDYRFQRVENLVINVVTAKALGLSLPWAVISEAELIGKAQAKDRKALTLYGVVQEARERNLILQANDQGLEASQQSVREATGALLPALEGSINGVWRDPDGATGFSPEQSLSWSGTASQVVVNEPALAQLSINRHLRDATRFDNRTAVLDVVQSASIGYLNVLRAGVTERIQRDNLKVTKTQLVQAQLRVEVGTGSRSEVVRLENQLANNRTSVIDAVASRNISEIQLLQLLNLASEEPIVLEDVSLEDSPLMASGERLQAFMDGPARFRILRQFMAQEALTYAPELKAGASRLAAQKRSLLSNQLALFIPRVSVSGSVTNAIATGGEGTSAEDQAIFAQNPFDWQVGVNATLGLWEGNARYARIRRERAEARSQALDLDAARIQIQADLRSTLHQAGASYAAIGILREAADAADENLTLIQEAYARGKEDIITLVDAQNQALTGRLNTNTAVYDFLIDLLDVQRAMGRFALLLSEAEVDDFFQRLQSFANTQVSDRD
ncbi:MAG: TolC family protein [Myxococcota bacterium]